MADRCALCDTASYDVLWRKDGFHYVRCWNCGLVYVLPRLTDDEIQEIYDDGFETKSAKHPLPVDFRSYDPILKALEPRRKKNRLLDVGCFKGHFMLAARDRGWLVRGTEICQQAATGAWEKHGLRVFCTATHLEFLNNWFDAVTLIATLEHLLNPLSYLQEIHRVLRPGGVVYVDVPNFNAIMRYVLKEKWSVFFPWHFTYFTAKTLRAMLSRAGFGQVQIVSTGLGPVSTFNPYLSLQKDSSITDSRPRLRDSSFVQRHKKPLKTAWLMAKGMGNIPFRLLSRAGVFAGSKLVAIATK